MNPFLAPYPDLLDRLVSHIRARKFQIEAQRLLRRAHHFKIPR